VILDAPGRILIVDDDDDLLLLTERVLAPLGFAIQTTNRADEALRLLAESSFDLVVSDLVMPGVDGQDLLEVMRGRGDKTAVLFLSGAASVPDVVKLMKSGAASFLQKPVDARELKREVLATLAEVRARRGHEETSLHEAASTAGSVRGAEAAVGARVSETPSSREPSAFRDRPTTPPPPAASSPASLPRLGRYLLLELLASGGMGRVYRAHDPNLDRIVAIKILLPPSTDAERAQFDERFRREAVALAKLRHPHILTVYDADVDPSSGTPYLVTELLAGESLERALASGPLSLDRALAFAEQLADALAFAHEQGIVHRDVKPDNVIIEHGTHARLIDFGVARTEGSEITHGAFLVGTPSYLSPEAAAGREIDGRADQFSLATLLVQMLTGKKVFRGEGIIETIRNVCDAPCPTLAELGLVGAPDELQALLTRMHAKSPSARVQEDRVLLGMLRTIRAGLGRAG
jgi:serine/threonine-protein kinase